ncbi:MAG: purine-nucleoside phosphorylase [Clostridiaceae bacterium]|jgi:purine-nucleoside phosphorylase|nr:purine-nucleoside phosphorylase [Clostridiaceae bacterium]
MAEQHNFEHYQKAADWLKERTAVRPEFAVILGSSLGAITERMTDTEIFDYSDIPGFLLPTNPSHAGKLVFGKMGERPTVIMSGRFHFYEGYSHQVLALPVRVLSLLGVKTLIVTNAAGGVNLDYQVGDIMVMSDHLNMVGVSPMTGPNIAAFGQRFYDVSKLYTPFLRQLAHETAATLTPPLTLREGVYYYCTGPHFETPAEIRAIRILGGDAVGMSTVSETLTAGHCGMEVLGFSLITNMAAGVLDQPLSDEEVGIAARAAADTMGALIEGIIARKG